MHLKRNAALLFIAYCLFMIDADAQRPLPNSYSAGNIKVNYVRMWDVVAPTSDANSLTLATDPELAKITTQYLDGLGRPLQTVIKKGSKGGNNASSDLVSPIEYDEFGREQFKYLPFASTGSDGLFKLDPFQQQKSFMESQFLGQGETYYYGQDHFEASPLNRVEKTLAPGNSWVGNGKGITTKYWLNTSIDAVHIWTVQNNGIGNFGTYLSGSGATYAAGALYKNVTEDENGRQVIEFKDKEGRVILKKVEYLDSHNGQPVKDDGAGKGHGGWLCTYYIYDDVGLLRCVIQPRAVELLEGNWQLTQAMLDDQCFRYEYDERGRMIVKQVPGAKPAQMVYDARDRLVMMQDGNQKAANKWFFTQYDDLNRPVTTGFITDPVNAGDPNFHRSQASGSTSYPNVSTYTNEVLTKTFYDNYDWLSQHAASGFSSTLSTTDNAHWLNPSTTNYPYPEAVAGSSAVHGLITGTMVKVVGDNSNQYLYSITYYDAKGRVLQVRSRNITGGNDVLTTQYSFSGLPLLLVQRSENGTGQNAIVQVTVTTNNYDELGRLDFVDKKVQSTLVNNNQISASKRLATMEYDALGQLRKKTLGKKKDILGNYTASHLEEIQYDYNIRGWMLGGNRAFAKDGTDKSKYFGFDLGYDKQPPGLIGTYAASQLNGNITGTVWKTKGDNEIRKYDFTYDAVNRLTGAVFKQNTGSNNWSSTDVDFTVSNLTYDANGNILTMNQRGLKIGGPADVDLLTYQYLSSTSNQLKEVLDGANDNTSKLGDFKYEATSKDGIDYAYDVNGNLTSDGNKNISSIVYNHLNLPSVITVSGKGTITYFYDAGGNKVKKVTDEPSGSVRYNGSDYITGITTTTLYIAGIVYESKSYTNAQLTSLGYTNRLQFLPHEEGRLRFIEQVGSIPTKFEWDYFLKDHLGNVRMVLTEEKKQDVYPVASLEGHINTDSYPNAAFKEKDYYAINPSRIVQSNTVTGLTTYQNNNGNPPYNNNDYSNHTANSEKVYELKATSSGGVTGLGMTLKVMGGDRIDIFGKSYWFQQNTGGNHSIPVSDIFAGLLDAPSGATAGKGATAAGLSGLPLLSGLVSGFLADPDRDNFGSTSVPKAYINWILFDENFKMVDGSFDRVSDNAGGSGVKPHALMDIEIKKNGYLYVYVSNESPVSVYFDNLQVIHTKDHILEETHYYPFGLSMSGISSRAAGGIQNRLKYNGKELQSGEFSDGVGLELHDYGARMYDNQIGRWHAIDSIADMRQEGVSPYSYVYNNPVLYSDHEGKFGFAGALIGGLIGGAASLTKSVIQNGFKSLGDSKTWAKAGVNAIGGAVVGATGGIAAFSTTAITITGMAATAVTSFGTSIAEDKIDGNEVDYGKAAASSFIATATFGFSKYGADKITKVVRHNWWNRGNTNAFVRYLGKNPTTHVGQVVDRVTDVAGIGTGLTVDLFFPPRSNATTTTSGDGQKVRKGYVIVHPLEKGPVLND